MPNYDIKDGPKGGQFLALFAANAEAAFTVQSRDAGVAGCVRVWLRALEMESAPGTASTVTHWNFEALGPQNIRVQGFYNVATQQGTFEVSGGRLVNLPGYGDTGELTWVLALDAPGAASDCREDDGAGEAPRPSAPGEVSTDPFDVGATLARVDALVAELGRVEQRLGEACEGPEAALDIEALRSSSTEIRSLHMLADGLRSGPDPDRLGDKLQRIADTLYARAASATCLGCSGRNDSYQVHISVWRQAKMPPYSNSLCLGCLEARLGRRLAIEDFVDAPINRPVFAGYRLRRSDV